MAEAGSRSAAGFRWNHKEVWDRFGKLHLMNTEEITRSLKRAIAQLDADRKWGMISSSARGKQCSRKRRIAWSCPAQTSNGKISLLADGQEGWMVGFGFGVEVESAFGIKKSNASCYIPWLSVSRLVSLLGMSWGRTESLQAQRACQRILVRGIHLQSYLIKHHRLHGLPGQREPPFGIKCNEALKRAWSNQIFPDFHWNALEESGSIIFFVFPFFVT
jgi:hypothetical protein